MAQREEIAPDLRAFVKPGDAVVWSNELATRSPLGWAVRAAFGGAAALAMAAIWLSPGGFADDLARVLLSVIPFLVFMATVMPLLEASTAYALVVGREHVVWRRGLPFGTINVVPRARIVSATVYEGDNTVHLHGEAGELARLPGIDYARDMALSLDVPVRVWIERSAPRHGGWIARTVIASGAALVAGVVNEIFLMIMTAESPSLRLASYAVLFCIAGGLLYPVGHWLQARRLSAEKCRETACYLIDPLWRGRDPYTSGISWWEVPVVAARLWLVRNFYGGPYDCRSDLEPLIIDPRSSAMPGNRRRST